MSIPPLHVERPAVLGHETIHLFGIGDRYFMAGQQLLSARQTGGRRDPLGVAREGAPLLAEDLDFLFENLGVYDREIDRELPPLLRVAREVLGMRHVPSDPVALAGEISRVQAAIDGFSTPPP